MAIYFEKAGFEVNLTEGELKAGLYEALDKLGMRQRVIAVPPDITRLHSRAGDLTRFAWEYYQEKLTDILPAIGTHLPMTGSEIGKMFGASVPKSLFRQHDWRTGIVTLGHVSADFIETISEGRLHFDWPAQVAKLIVNGGHDLILSIGQVVPHEVSGMANYNKNIFIGIGGKESLHRSHYLSAVYGMERIMGRADNPVRRVLDYASEHFTRHLPIVYVLTVVEHERHSGKMLTRGLFIGDDLEVFHKAAKLSFQVNIEFLDKPLRKIVVYLEATKFKSTWLGNKAIYRTRMAMANGGELIVLAPGVRQFGEDPTIDKRIRKYGYAGTETILNLVKQNKDLQHELSAAAHLIHGSSDGRFSIIYCPGHLSRDEIIKVHFKYIPLTEALKKYDPLQLKEGLNEVDGEEIYFISDPAAGLWAVREKFENA